MRRVVTPQKWNFRVDLLRGTINDRHQGSECLVAKLPLTLHEPTRTDIWQLAKTTWVFQKFRTLVCPAFFKSSGLIVHDVHTLLVIYQGQQPVLNQLA
jgi:hypothetical protein